VAASSEPRQPPFLPAPRRGYNSDMSDDRKKSGWPWIVAALIVLPVYVISGGSSHS